MIITLGPVSNPFTRGWRGHFILEGLKFVVRDDYPESDLAGAAVKE